MAADKKQDVNYKQGKKVQIIKWLNDHQCTEEKQQQTHWQKGD